MLAPNTIQRDTLNGMDLDTAKSDGSGKVASHQLNQASSFEAGKFSVGELYGCICHRPMTEICTSPISLDTAGDYGISEHLLKQVGSREAAKIVKLRR